MSDSPESAVLDLGDLEVNGFGAIIIGILYDDADDAGWKEVADCLGRKDDATPVGESVLSDWREGVSHGGQSELCYGDRYWMKE